MTIVASDFSLASPALAGCSSIDSAGLSFAQVSSSQLWPRPSPSHLALVSLDTYLVVEQMRWMQQSAIAINLVNSCFMSDVWKRFEFPRGKK